MNHPQRLVIDAVVVDEASHLSLQELSLACRARSDWLIALVQEGVLQPEGEWPESWRFNGPSLHRARKALRLSRDLGLNTGGTALVLDLLERIEALESKLHRAGLD